MVTLPTSDIIVNPMTLAGLEPPPASQTIISPLDKQTDKNIYHKFDPIIDRSTYGQGMDCPEMLTSLSDIIIESDFQDFVRSTFPKKYPEQLSADMPFDNTRRWFKIPFQSNQ